MGCLGCCSPNSPRALISHSPDPIELSKLLAMAQHQPETFASSSRISTHLRIVIAPVLEGRLRFNSVNPRPLGFPFTSRRGKRFLPPKTTRSCSSTASATASLLPRDKLRDISPFLPPKSKPSHLMHIMCPLPKSSRQPRHAIKSPERQTPPSSTTVPNAARPMPSPL